MRYILLSLAIVCASSAALVAQDKNAIAHGEKIYNAQKCSVCHSIGGKGNAKGPLDNIGAKLSDEEIRQWLIAPRVMAEKAKTTRKPLMPEYTKLSKQDLEGVVAYLRAQKK